MNILVFGSINKDMTYHLDQFVRPKETISAKSMEVFLGGKGLNQATALARAGCKVFLAGNISCEDQGLLKEFHQLGIQTNYIGLIENAPTGHAIIQVDNTGQNCIIIYSGANHKITKQQIDNVLQKFQPGDMLVLQNEINGLHYLMESAYTKGMSIVFNPSPFDDSISHLPLEKITWLILNEVEGESLTGEKIPKQMTEKLIQKYPNCRIVLTLGSEGVLYRDASQFLTHGIYNVPVVDTTAAGDTFTGYFISEVSKGTSVEEALRIASIASSLAISRKGATCSIPTYQEVSQSKLIPIPFKD